MTQKSKTCTLEIYHKDGYKVVVENVEKYSWEENHLIIIGNEYNTVPAMNIAMVKEIKEVSE